MKIQYTDYVDVLYAPESAKPKLAEVQAKETGDDKRPYRIDVTNSVRNRDGHRTSFQKDILSLRRFGAILEVHPNADGKKLIAEGKINKDTHAAIKPSGVTLEPETPPAKAKKS